MKTAPVKFWQYVGGRNLQNAIDAEGLSAAASDLQLGSLREFINSLYREISDVNFWSALEFTLLYLLRPPQLS